MFVQVTCTNHVEEDNLTSKLQLWSLFRQIFLKLLATRQTYKDYLRNLLGKNVLDSLHEFRFTKMRTSIAVYLIFFFLNFPPPLFSFVIILLYRCRARA